MSDGRDHLGDELKMRALPRRGRGRHCSQDRKGTWGRVKPQIAQIKWKLENGLSSPLPPRCVIIVVKIARELGGE